MKKIIRVLVLLAILSPVVGLAFTYNSLPQQVPLHFNAEGTPDRIGHKSELWLVMALICGMSLLIYLLLPQVYKIDPKKTAVENVPRLRKLATVISIMTSAIAWLVLHTVINGSFSFGMQYLFIGLGILWCFLGNYMYNLRPNYFAGVRLPWTLNNEENWRRTHWLAGKLFFAGGLIIISLALLFKPQLLVISFVVITFLTLVTTVIYSYRLHKKMTKMNVT